MVGIAQHQQLWPCVGIASGFPGILMPILNVSEDIHIMPQIKQQRQILVGPGT
jgi:hypothetical protein